MKKSVSSHIPIPILLAVSAVISVQTHSAAFEGAREDIINAQMDCISNYIDDNEAQWGDVCYTVDNVKDKKARLVMDADGNVYMDDGSSTKEDDVRAFLDEADNSREEDYIDYVDASKTESAEILDGKDYGLDYYDAPSTLDDEEGFFWHLFDRNNPRNEIAFGSEAFFFTYREPSLMRIRGIMYGSNLEYIYRWSQNQHVTSFKDAFSDKSKINLIKLDAKFAFGQGDYESEGTGMSNDEDHWMYELRGMAGYEIPVLESTVIMPYAGLGYRRLYNDARGLSTTNNFGYRRYSKYFYAPFGIETETKLKGRWSVGTKIEYDLFLDGEQQSYLGDGGVYNSYYVGYPVVKNDQNHGRGYRASITVQKETDNVDFFIEPFVNYWSIKDSEVTTITHNSIALSWIEPENNTTEYGVKVGAHF